MTGEVPGLVITVTAGEAITQYTAVRMESDGKVDFAGATPGEDGLGVAQIAASADGDAIPAMVTGISWMKVGTGGITVGEKVQLIADGIAAAASGDYVFGVAFATGLVGELVPVLLGSNHLNA